MMRRCFVVFMAAMCFAGQGRYVCAQEAGSYERKSISFIDRLWYMDKAAQSMPNSFGDYALSTLKGSLLLQRFDRNPLAESMVGEFVTTANRVAAPDPASYMDSLTSILNATLVPAIVEIVEMNKATRGKALQSEQQRNSFITDKAKELGLTARQLERLMNSAFVFIPVCSGFKEERKEKLHTVELDLGILMWRIVTDSGQTRAQMVLKKLAFCSGSATAGEQYLKNGKKIGHRQYAFESAVNNGVMNLKVALQELDEFRLSTQVTEKRPGKVAFGMGAREGLTVDDKYRIVKAIENPDGTIDRQKRGWVVVRKVAADKKGEEYKSWAKVIAGRPHIGSELDEYPRIPMDITLGGQMFPAKTARKNYSDLFVDSLDVSGAYGFFAGIGVNLGGAMGIPQLFFDAGYGMGFGSASGTGHFGSVDVELSRLMIMNFQGRLIKKFYVRRFALILRPGFSYTMIDLQPSMDPTADYDYRLKAYALGFLGEGGVEIALSPAVNVGATAGYDLFSPTRALTSQSRATGSSDWSDIREADDTSGNGVDLDGLRIGVHLVISPPSLPNDPIKALKRKMSKK